MGFRISKNYSVTNVTSVSLFVIRQSKDMDPQQPPANQQESLNYGLVYNGNYPNLGMLSGNGTILNIPNQHMLTLSMTQPPAQGTTEEPLYVNAKQYHRILKRREARARWETQFRNQKKDKVSLLLRSTKRDIFMNPDTNTPCVDLEALVDDSCLQQKWRHWMLQSH